MMKATITVRMDNAAFANMPDMELCRILRDLSQRLADCGLPKRGEPWQVLDFNGNTVGEFKIT